MMRRIHNSNNHQSNDIRIVVVLTMPSLLLLVFGILQVQQQLPSFNHVLPTANAYTTVPIQQRFALCSTTQQKHLHQLRLSTTDGNNDFEVNGSSTSASVQQQSISNTYVRCGKCQTAYAISDSELGTRGGRRLECSICAHSWFQTRDRLLSLTSEFELQPLPDRDVERIKNNIEQGKSAKFMGEKKLYVGNLAFQCHEDDLYEIFGQYGDVGEVNLIRDEYGKPRGFGFVTMRTDEGGDKAIANADGLMIRGRNIAVRESNS